MPQTKVRDIPTGIPAQPQGSREIRTHQSLGLILRQREIPPSGEILTL